MNQPTIGPLHGVAEMTVLRWDTQTRRFVDYRVVAVHPDRTVTVAAALPWPEAPAAASGGAAARPTATGTGAATTSAP